MRAENASLHIVPRDGVRRRFYLRAAGQNIDLELTGARFAKEEPIQWSTERHEFVFALETETTAMDVVQLRIVGLPTRSYKAICGQATSELNPNGKTLQLHVHPGSTRMKVQIVRS
jgi:hypothetical protein